MTMVGKEMAGRGVLMKKKFLFVYCGACRTCRYRRFKNLFDFKSMLDCADCNGLSIQTIIPFILWRVNWCKLYEKRNGWKEIR